MVLFEFFVVFFEFFDFFCESLNFFFVVVDEDLDVFELVDAFAVD